MTMGSKTNVLKVGDQVRVRGASNSPLGVIIADETSEAIRGVSGLEGSCLVRWISGQHYGREETVKTEYLESAEKPAQEEVKQSPFPVGSQVVYLGPDQFGFPRGCKAKVVDTDSKYRMAKVETHAHGKYWAPYEHLAFKVGEKIGESLAKQIADKIEKQIKGESKPPLTSGTRVVVEYGKFASTYMPDAPKGKLAGTVQAVRYGEDGKYQYRVQLVNGPLVEVSEDSIQDYDMRKFYDEPSYKFCTTPLPITHSGFLHPWKSWNKAYPNVSSGVDKAEGKDKSVTGVENAEDKYKVKLSYDARKFTEQMTTLKDSAERIIDKMNPFNDPEYKRLQEELEEYKKGDVVKRRIKSHKRWSNLHSFAFLFVAALLVASPVGHDFVKHELPPRLEWLSTNSLDWTYWLSCAVIGVSGLSSALMAMHHAQEADKLESTPKDDNKQ